MITFTTGSPDLDNLLEELRIGDNVVFYADTPNAYVPFVATLARYLASSPEPLIYVRSSGLLDDTVIDLPHVRILNAADLVAEGDAVLALAEEARRIGPMVYYVFDPLYTWSQWLPGVEEDELGRFFTTICPLLYQLQSIAYWVLLRGHHQSTTLARIKECTQVFIRLEGGDIPHAQNELLFTPIKVLERYSEDMFRPHRVTMIDGQLNVMPLPIEAASRSEYVEALTDKNRELAELRDALDRSNRALQSRNEELDVLNRQLSEQNRLYRSLRANLDHLEALFRAGREIGSTLMVDQVRQAIVRAAQRVFNARGARLRISDGGTTFALAEGDFIPHGGLPSEDALDELCARVIESGSVQSLSVDGGGSLAVAPITIRGRAWGTLELAAPDVRLDSDDVRTLLGFLVLEAGIALDNAHLHRETEIQGEQLRSFIEDVIVSEERDNRRLAFDLHDGLVQMIVASFQHLQTAQAWQDRDPGAAEREFAHGIRLLRQSINEARRLIAQLRPPGLDDLGLAHALRLFSAQMSEEADWQVSIDIDPAWPALSSELEAALFRIVQEAINNARKYARASRARIRLVAHADELCVMVRDWGQGFDPAEIGAEGSCESGIGLVGIRERARHWGGHCQIHSRPGQGTTVTVCIPRLYAQEVPSHD